MLSFIVIVLISKVSLAFGEIMRGRLNETVCPLIGESNPLCVFGFLNVPVEVRQSSVLF